MSSEYNFLNLDNDEGTKSLMTEILSSVPGIDEAISFNQLVKYFLLESVQLIVWIMILLCLIQPQLDIP